MNSEKDPLKYNSIAIRSRATMYLGGEPSEPASQINLIKESFCHAIDEHVEGNCSSINLSINNNGFEIFYDAALSLEIRECSSICIAEELMTTIFACREQKKNHEIGNKFCRSGMVVVNALSHNLQLEVQTERFYGKQEYIRGIPVNSFQIIEQDGKPYTRIKSILDLDIFKSVQFDISIIESWIKELTREYKGLKIELIDQTTK